jgi:uncharacterized membrane protein YedE/YeeE
MTAARVPSGRDVDEVLLQRPEWYIAGPLIGLVVVGLLAALNERLGVLGGYTEIVDHVGRRSVALGWRAFFVVGIVAGGLVFSVVSGNWRASDSYGWLSRSLDGGAVVALLVGAGILVGFGAKRAGGCTSGNGLSGCSFGSLASFVATGTFMAAAVGVAFLTRALIGAGG